MSLQDHVDTLRAKHAELEAEIRQEIARPWPNEQRLSDLKRQKLRIKDTITRLIKQEEEALHAGVLRAAGRSEHASLR
ncbi:MAG TPA: DUF465 domain-containing protein [Stellaceae bacterium]|nr:DUF465 domain-containing protein [Stellaceae bacterium]